MALLLWAAMSSFIFLQAADYQSQTTADPDISVESLKLRVIPLEKSELQVETEAWQDLLKSKATEIIELEIQGLDRLSSQIQFQYSLLIIFHINYHL